MGAAPPTGQDSPGPPGMRAEPCTWLLSCYLQCSHVLARLRLSGHSRLQAHRPLLETRKQRNGRLRHLLSGL